MQESQTAISDLKGANTTILAEKLELMETNKRTGEELKRIMNERDILKRKTVAWQVRTPF